MKLTRCFVEGGSVPLSLPRRPSLTVFSGFFVFLLDVACVDLDPVGLRDMTRVPNLVSSSTMTQTHHPLIQPDLFQCVLDSLEGVYCDGGERRQTLLVLAQTCRAFSEPSLDRLWSRLDSLTPLIQCFSSVLDEERASRFRSMSVFRSLCRNVVQAPSPSEWAVIRRYSHRIKELRISPLDQPSYVLLQSIGVSSQSFFPNLRSLYWCPASALYPHSSLCNILLRHLLSPLLESLTISLTNVDDATFQLFLANYPLLCPNLKFVAIIIPAHKTLPQTTVASLSQAITLHNHLEHLHLVAPINDVAFTHIAMSPRLKSLSLILRYDMPHLHRVCLPSDIVPFFNLEVLDLNVWNLPFVTTLLRPHGQTFREIHLVHHTKPTINAISAFFTALSSPARACSLRLIMLWTREDRSLVPIPQEFQSELDMSPFAIHISHDTLHPLTRLAHLRELCIRLDHWISLSDDGLISLARHWPHLEVLELRCARGVDLSVNAPRYLRPWASLGYVTLRGLLAFLACCPDLYSLSLPLDARDVPVDTADGMDGVVCHPVLTSVHFRYAPIYDPRAVAAFLERHLPSVMHVDTSFQGFTALMHTPEIVQHRAAWRQVNMYLGKRRAWQAGVVTGTFDFAFSPRPGSTCMMERCIIVTITGFSKVVNPRVSRECGKIGCTGRSGCLTWFAWFYSS